MVRVDSSSMISTNKKIIEKRLTKIKEEYLRNQNIEEISNYCKLNEVSTVHMLNKIILKYYKSS